MSKKHDYTKKRPNVVIYKVTPKLANLIQEKYKVFAKKNGIKWPQGNPKKDIPPIDFRNYGFKFKSYSTMRRFWTKDQAYKEYIESCCERLDIKIELCNEVINIAKLKGEKLAL